MATEEIWIHRELKDRLLRTLYLVGWSTERDVCERDSLFAGMHVDLLLYHQEEGGRVERRQRADGAAEFRLTPAGFAQLWDA